MRRAILAVITLGLVLASTGPLLTLASARTSAVEKKKRVHPIISLERTICFGSCPVYKLTIYSNGRVVYQGIRYVKRKGKAVGHISRQMLDDLVMKFISISYFDLDNEYVPGSSGCPQVITDLPSANTSLNFNGRKKTIRHYHGCGGHPALGLLTELENDIDQAVNVKKWTK